MFGKKQGKTYQLIGVDFGSQTIKAVAISGRKGSFQIDSAVEVACPQGAVVNGKIQDKERVEQALAQLSRSIASRGKFVATAVSGTDVVTRTITLPRDIDSDKELGDQVQAQSEQLIPFQNTSIALDYGILGPNNSDSDQNDVLVTAARGESVLDRSEVMAQCGYEVKVVDVGYYALARAVMALVPKLNPDPSGANLPPTAAIVDFGASETDIIFLENGRITSTKSIPTLSGAVYDKRIAAKTGYPAAEAERAKTQSRLPPEVEEDVTKPYIASITKQIAQAVRIQQSKVSLFVLTGGSSLIPGLQQAFIEVLKTETIVPDPFDLNPKLRTEYVQHGAKYMTALGLALRSFDNESPNINLVDWRAAEAKQKTHNFFVMAIAFAVVGALIDIGIWTMLNAQIDNQNERNGYLTSQISLLQDKINEIEKLKKERDEMINRMKLIEQLQQSRSTVVNIFSDFPTLVANGIYLDKIDFDGIKISVEGLTETLARVSEMYRNIDIESKGRYGNVQISSISEDKKNDSKSTMTLSKFGLSFVSNAMVEAQKSLEKKNEKKNKKGGRR